jgi:predicted nucleic acid binding AN1-type Zn finger protein
MRCLCCKKKKGIPIDCKYCGLGYCSGCIQLEVHACKGMETKKDDELKTLEKQLDFKPDKKFGMV